jgi:(S)-ureidoglycine aminohydrolase
MKNLVLIGLLLAISGSIEVQAQILDSRVYPLERGTAKKTQLFSGSGSILSNQTATYHTLSGGKQTAIISGKQEEVLVIIKNGKANVQLLEEQKVLEQGSVVFLLPGERVLISNSTKEAVTYYTLTASSTTNFSEDRGRQGGSSFIMDWKDMVFKPHSKGGVRQLFNRPTAMLNKFDIHITTLDVGVKSHDPHTHTNEEIILLLSGNAEMQIDQSHQKASGGDAVWLGSMVLHNLTNIGNIPCLYYAIQWN